MGAIGGDRPVTKLTLRIGHMGDTRSVRRAGRCRMPATGGDRSGLAFWKSGWSEWDE
jgi:hypothetical protein